MGEKNLIFRRGGGTPVVERFAFTTGQEARAGKNSFPPTPLPFCPPERKLSKVSVRIFSKKSSDFVQDRQPICSGEIAINVSKNASSIKILKH